MVGRPHSYTQRIKASPKALRSFGACFNNNSAGFDNTIIHALLRCPPGKQLPVSGGKKDERGPRVIKVFELPCNSKKQDNAIALSCFYIKPFGSNYFFKASSAFA